VSSKSQAANTDSHSHTTTTGTATTTSVSNGSSTSSEVVSHTISTPHSSLSSIQSQLESQRDDLANKAAVLRTQLSSLESDVHRIDAALAALTGTQVAAKGQEAGEPKQKKERKAASPAIGKSQVIELINKQLKGQEAIVVDELRRRIEAELGQLGFSRLGFALRFKEALDDKAFTVANGQVSKAAG
jgi:HPt (histidine-containing phosphotransfer) domain-containing protein